MIKQARLACLTIVLLLAAAALVYAQAVNGSLVGTISDSSGASVPEAKVTATDVNTGVSRSISTDQGGYYAFPNLTPGQYKVSVSKPGFSTVVRAAVGVLVNSTVRVDLSLEPGMVSQTVNVTATIPMLQTDTSDTGRKVDVEQVAMLPLGTNRNFQNLLFLTPGTTHPEFNHSRFFNPQNTLNSQVNGTNSLGNMFQIEGVGDNERTGLLQVYVPPSEAIAEVDVTTSNYDAELGTALGAVTNVVLKSGGNQFHGSAYEFWKGDSLIARSFFQRGPNGTPFVKPPFVYNYFGGSLGGPIRKNKTFFFVDYLRLSDHEGQFQTLSVPTAAMRNGDFTDPFLTNIYDPSTGSPSGTGRQQLSCNGVANMICPGRIDAVAAKILALVPLPNTGQSATGSARYQNNYLETTPFTQDNNTLDVKIDEYAGQADHISGRFSYMNPQTYQGPAYGTAGGPVGGGFEGTGTDKTYSAGVNWDHTFSPTLLTQARIGLNRYRNDARQVDYGSSASTTIGIPGVNVEPFSSGLTGVTGEGFSDPMVGYSASLPWVRAETDFDFVNNWNKIIRSHTLKFGVEAIRIRDDLLQEQTFSPRGLWSFSSGQTALNGGPKAGFANQFASFLLGIPNSVGRDLAIVFPAYRQTQLFTYFNDKWQVDPKLTLNLGLRWEFYAPATPHYAGGFSNYDPNNNNLVVAGVGGNPINAGVQSRYHDFAPRLGAAYRLTNKDVLRGGFGVSYEPFLDNTYAYNYPVKQNNSFTNQGNSFGPAILPNGSPATFEAGFPAPLVAATPSNGIISANTPLLLNQSYQVINPHYLDPYVESWNLAYEHVLPGQFVLDIAYVGNHGVHIPVQYNMNAGFVAGAGKLGQPEYAAFGRTASTTLFFAGYPSSYNSLQVKLDHHFSSGFSLTTAYTYGKALGYEEENGENSSSLQYYIDQGRNWARTDFDHTHTLTESYLWELPLGKGHRLANSTWGNRLVGGWQFSGILSFYTGSPLNFTYNGPFNTPGNHQSPNVSGSIRKLKGVDTQLWFDTSVFSAPDASTFGNVGPYILSGPNVFNLDASLFKNIQISERFKLEFRSEWFSATNTPQFNNPDVTLGDSNFGRVTSVNGGNRNIDFALKLLF